MGLSGLTPKLCAAAGEVSRRHSRMDMYTKKACVQTGAVACAAETSFITRRSGKPGYASRRTAMELSACALRLWTTSRHTACEYLTRSWELWPRCSTNQGSF